MRYKAIVSIFVMMLVVSSVTAVNIDYSDDKEINNLDSLINKVILENYDISILERIINKYIEHRDFDSLIGGMDIIEECINYYNDNNVRTALNLGKNEINDLINNNETLKSFFDVEKTFNLENILNRIKTLKPSNVIEDVNTLLKPQKNYNKFVESREQFGESFMEYFEQYFYNETTLLDNVGNLIPIVDDVCIILAKISLLWSVPLTILGGLLGLFIASIITYVFFAPITIPLSLYMSVVYLIENGGSELAEELVGICVMYGLVGLIVMGLPILFKLMFLEPAGIYGITYVMDKISIISLLETIGNYDLETGSNPPRIYAFNFDKPIYENVEMEFRIDVSDNDKIKWNGEKENRDFVQVGIDWNNDFIFDTWSNFDRDKDGDYTKLKIRHTFPEPDIKTINVIAFDINGGFSNIESYNIRIHDNAKNFKWSFPLFRNLYWKLIECF